MGFRVLHITLRSDIGGGPEHVFRLASELKEGVVWEQYIAAPKQEPYYELFNKVTEDKFFELPWRKFNIRYLVKLVRYVKSNNIKIIHSHGKGAGVYSRLVKIAIPQIRVVHTFHGWHVGKYGSLMTHLYNAYETLLSFITTKLICVSHSEYTGLPNALKRIGKDKLTIVPNGVGIPETLQDFKVRNIDVIVITRFDYQKNFEFALDIIENMPNVNFSIVGPVDEAGRLHIDYCSKRGITNVDFIGASDNVRYYLRRAKLVLSTSRWEGLSLAILEAMSEGCVPILSEVTGNTDIQVPKSLFYHEGDLLMAVNAINSVLKDEQKWSDYSELSSKLVVENHSVSTMANGVANIYSSII